MIIIKSIINRLEEVFEGMPRCKKTKEIKKVIATDLGKAETRKEAEELVEKYITSRKRRVVDSIVRGDDVWCYYLKPYTFSIPYCSTDYTDVETVYVYL